MEYGGDPLLVDETLERFRPETVGMGDIVGIGITSGNCRRGYQIAAEAKRQGATVVMGGIHTTIFPQEPLEMGADAVVTGSGEAIWPTVIGDAVDGRLKKIYGGGRLSGGQMGAARWDLLDPSRYMFPTIQTVAGCPENCSFCSVWVTEGRTPRMRLAENIIAEANELYRMGFRYIVFADDNFNPATLGRIEREPGAGKRKQFESVREERLRLFDEYDRGVPKNFYGLTQMTVEVLSDEEYLTAMRDKMRVRGAVIGVESFSEEGLDTVNKAWNPAGQKMVEAVQAIQEKGLFVLASIICGLESDTPQTIRTMRQFALDSGALFAQFTMYNPLPGTKDYHEMVSDRKSFATFGYQPRHRAQLLADRFWLDNRTPLDLVRLPKLSRAEWATETMACWRQFYSVKETLQRLRTGAGRNWPLAGKITYFFASLVFRRVYAGNGLSADAENRTRRGVLTRMMIRAGVAVYGYFFRQKRVAFRLDVVAAALRKAAGSSAVRS
ncbi:MAG: B12-binding domain-containing radical SAM protein [Bryobacteraceae bacterium]